MSTYQCRLIKPKELAWESVIANSPKEAAQDYFFDKGHHIARITYVNVLETDAQGRDKRKELVYFGEIEIDGYKTVIARIFYAPIWRPGGVKPLGYKHKTLADIKEELNWPGTPESLIEPGWDYEESDWK